MDHEELVALEAAKGLPGGPKRKETMDVLDLAAINHKPRKYVALLSGGHDSLTATAVAHDWAYERGVNIEVAHIKTGIGIPETTEFVHEICADKGWDLHVYEPPRSYESLVMEFGFPGPGYHELPYQRLKERCFRRMVAERKEHWRDRVMFISGVRAQESTRRTKHVEKEQREGARVWAAPLWNWSKVECSRYLEKEGFPRNPVVDLLHMSGECLCGAFAGKGEIKEIERWFPEAAEQIHAMERKAEAKGLRGCVWGQRPPKVHREQLKLLGFEENHDSPGMLCQDCGPWRETEAAA